MTLLVECYLHARRRLDMASLVALRWARVHAPDVAEARARWAALGYPEAA